MKMLPFLVFPVVVYMSVFGFFCSGSMILTSNAIKNLPTGPGTPNLDGGYMVNTTPDEFSLLDGGSQNLVIDPIQSLTCHADKECGDNGFCFAPRRACLPCKRRRKRCARDAMCCHGNQCSNGVCLPVDSDITQQFAVEEMAPTVTIRISSNVIANGHEENTTAELEPQTTTTQHLTFTSRGLEGESCLRSSDCSEGLCCARHFWSKICKPVLREGQVCTKHRKKGALGLELFQRCDCKEGLACRTQRGDNTMSKAVRSLHTCQPH